MVLQLMNYQLIFCIQKSTDHFGLCFEHILEYNNYNNIPFSKLKSYLAVDCCGEVCSECLEGLTAKDFALAALDLKTGAAGTEGR